VRSILSDFSAAIAHRVTMERARILDVGCGDGAFARELSRGGAQVTGVECSEAQLALCRQAPRVTDEQYLFGVGQALPFDDNAFDVTAFRASLHHVPADRMVEALLEARRVTRPSGEIHVFEPLTTGTHFELTRLVDDETTVRAQAQEAIEQAIATGRLSRRHTQTLTAEVVYADLDALRTRILAIDSSRAERFAAVEANIRRVMESTGARCDGGFLFTQPFRLDVLA